MDLDFCRHIKCKSRIVKNNFYCTSGFFKKINLQKFFISFISVLPIVFIFISGCVKNPDSYPPEGIASSVKEITDDNRSENYFPEFEVYKVKYMTVRKNMEAPGTLAVINKATVVSRLEGILEEVFVKKGDKVLAGDPLFFVSNYQLELDSESVEKQLLEAERELETARLQYQEQRKALFKKIIKIEKLKLQREDMMSEVDMLLGTLDKKRILHERGGITDEAFESFVFSIESKKRELGILDKEIEVQEFGFKDEDILQEGYMVPDDPEYKKELLVYINTKLQRKQIEFAKIRVTKAELAMERAKWLMSLRTIRAPISGIVTEIERHPGEKIRQDQPITTIIDNSVLNARASFSEGYYSHFKTGMAVDVYVNATSEKITGKIRGINPVVDPETRSIRIDCEVLNKRELLPGMSVRIVFPISRKIRDIVIPSESCLLDGVGNVFVLIVSDSERVFRKRIIVEKSNSFNMEIFSEGQADGGGLFNCNYVTVKEGLKDGDLILLKPLSNIADGTRIRYRKAEQYGGT